MSNINDNKKINQLEERIQVLEKLNNELVEQNKQLIDENRRKENLLSFLPTKSIDDIKIQTREKALRFKMSTVLFSDVKGLTTLTEQESPEVIIDELDRFYFHFDNIIKQFNIHKIKSIGDSYIAAGGIPKKNRTNPIEVVMAAYEMQHYLFEFKARYDKKDVKIWDITFGIHTGPVVAKVTGTKKNLYELSGDAVNIASRIESTSEFGRINISSDTYEVVKEFFVCEYRGKLPVKYRGELSVYSIKGYRPELSINAKGKIPNDLFWTRLQMIRFEDLSEFILDKLEQELPKYLYYHDLKHTIDVTIGVEIIGTGENLSEAEILLLKTAALFHDSGRIKCDIGHEKESCILAKKILPDFGYNEQQIKIIENLILATQQNYKPKSILEKVIIDANLDYLGRNDYIPVSESLYNELKVQNLVESMNDWYKEQLELMEKHQFLTETALTMRQVTKEKQIGRLKRLIKK